MVLSVYSIVPVTKLSLEYNFSKGYLRVFKNPKSAKFLLLIEQLAIWKQILMLTEIYEYLEKSISQQRNPQDLLFSSYRILIKMFDFQIKSRSKSSHGNVDILQENINLFGGFALAYKQLGKKMLIVKAGFRFVRMNYKNYYPKEIGKGSKELVYIVEEHQQYGFINYSGEVQYGELDIQITLKACSVCLIAKVDLANNIFCRHRYCEHCLKIYFRNKYSIVCPVFGCNAKLIRRLITLKIKLKSSDLHQQKERKVAQNLRCRTKCSHFINGSKLASQICWFQSTQLFGILIYLIKKIIEYQCGEKQFTQDDIKNNNNLCSQCLMTLQDAQVKARCNRHYVCIQCTLNAQQTCLLC